MTYRLKFLTLLVAFSCLTAWAEPALAARLASVNGQADATEVSDEAEFKLSDETRVEVNYNTTQRDKACSVHVRIRRENAAGEWLVVNTVLRTSKSERGSSSVNLPPGNYRIEVVATHSRYSVSVDK